MILEYSITLILNQLFFDSLKSYNGNIFIFYYILIGAMAVKKKVHKIRKDKLSTRLLTASEIKPEPIEVIEIFDD